MKTEEMLGKIESLEKRVLMLERFCNFNLTKETIKLEDYRFGFGEFRNKSLKEIPQKNLENWFRYWTDSKKKIRMNGALLEAYQNVSLYLNHK